MHQNLISPPFSDLLAISHMILQLKSPPEGWMLQMPGISEEAAPAGVFGLLVKLRNSRLGKENESFSF